MHVCVCEEYEIKGFIWLWDLQKGRPERSYIGPVVCLRRTGNNISRQEREGEK